MNISFADQIGRQKLSLDAIPDPTGDIWTYSRRHGRNVLKAEYLYRGFERIEIERKKATKDELRHDMFGSPQVVKGEPEQFRANVYARNGRFLTGRWRTKRGAAEKDGLAMNTSVNIARALGCL